MNNSLEIRDAAENDFEQLMELFDELDGFHRHAKPELFHKPKGNARERTDIAKMIAGPDSAILVAADDSRVLGLATLFVRRIPAHLVQRERQYVEVDNLAVKAEARRTGIGRALVARAQDWAIAQNVVALEIGVHEFNSGAIAFYEALGFLTVRRRMALLCA